MLINLIISVLIGALCGWIAGKIMNLKGSFIFNAILGIVGSVVGRLIAGLLGISASKVSIGGIIISVAGACLVVWAVRKLTAKKKSCRRGASSVACAHTACLRARTGVPENSQETAKNAQEDAPARIYYVGTALFSRSVSRQVFSARVSLTAVFGMGTGGPSPLKTPTDWGLHPQN